LPTNPLVGSFDGKLTASLEAKGSIILAIGMMLVGMLLLAALASSPSIWVIALDLGLIAVGYGLSNPPCTDLLMSVAPDDFEISSVIQKISAIKVTVTRMGDCHRNYLYTGYKE
jgi:hypothetical protein